MQKLSRRRPALTWLAAAALFACAGTAAVQAQAQTIEKMKQFKVATTDLNLPTVAQEGRNAAAIRKNLEEPLRLML